MKKILGVAVLAGAVALVSGVMLARGASAGAVCPKGMAPCSMKAGEAPCTACPKPCDTGRARCEKCPLCGESGRAQTARAGAGPSIL